jgi:catechol 2,3-dioxygenase-like lactoylglutathione lyase family enzyme
MKLNHLNLKVTDVPATVAFLQTYFALRPQSANDRMAFLSDGAGFFLALFKQTDPPVSYPPEFHIGFYVDSEAEVDAINRRLRDDGYDVAEPKQDHGYKFYLNAPGGFLLEVSFYPWKEKSAG